jgi:osmotically-inducible protein OsmY
MRDYQVINGKLMPTKKHILLIALLGSSLLSGCTTLILGGAAAGANVVHDRRTTGTYVEDKEILLRAISMRSADKALIERSNISIDVYNLRILLTGQAESLQPAENFRQQLQTIPRVREVFNEVKVAAEGTWGDTVSDTYLTSRVKFALLDIELENFDPTRVHVTSSLGTVYLMGLLTHEEAHAVTEKVRFINGVKRVVQIFDYIEN